MPVSGTHVWQYRDRSSIVNRGWLGHDREWEIEVVEKIRLSGRAPEMAETSPRDNYSSAWWLRDYAVARAATARKERGVAWKAEVAKQRGVLAQKKAARLAEEAERREAKRVWLEGKAERDRIKAEQDAAWEAEERLRKAEREQAEAEARAERARQEAKRKADAAERERITQAATVLPPRPPILVDLDAKRQEERRVIFANPWQCKRCLKMAKIEAKGTGYVLRCEPCGVQTGADHTTLMRMIAA